MRYSLARGNRSTAKRRITIIKTGINFPIFATLRYSIKYLIIIIKPIFNSINISILKLETQQHFSMFSVVVFVHHCLKN